MLTLAPSLDEAFASDPLVLRHIVRIRYGKRLYLRVDDYTLASGDAVIVNTGTAYAMTEGFDFTASTSNAETARAIAEAYQRADVPFNAYADGDLVTFVAAHDQAVFVLIEVSDAWSEVTPRETVGTISFVDGDEALFGYSPSIVEVAPFAAELDPIERTLKRVGDVDVVFEDDGSLRNLNVLFPDLIGKVVEIEVGGADVPEADFAPYAVVQIEDIVAERRGAIRLKCKDVGALLRDQDVRVDVVNAHPLEAILLILQTAGVSSALYDATTLDPTAYSDIGHFCVSRHHLWTTDASPWDGTEIDPKMDSPTNALDLVNDLLRLLDGSFLPGEDGRYRFQRYDATASSIGTWDEVRDYTPQGVADRMVNHVIVEGGRKPNETQQGLFETYDLNAASRFTRAGAVPRRRTVRIPSDWLIGNARLYRNFGASDTTIQLKRFLYTGMSGTRISSAPTVSPITQATNTDLSSTRLAYLLLIDEIGNVEAISCDGTTFPPPGMTGQNPDLIGPSLTYGWQRVDLSVAERGLFGTSARDWNFILTPIALVLDITMAVDCANRKLARLAQGLPIIDFDTDHRRYAGQLGDLIALPHATYIEPGLDGATTVELFEIIRKEARRNGISYRVARAGTLTPRITPVAIVPPVVVPPLIGPGYRSTHSVQLDGAADYVDCGDVSALDAATTFAIAGWMRSVGSLPGNGEVISRWDSGNEQFRIQVQGAELYIAITDGSNTYELITTDSPLSANTWHHVVLACDLNTPTVRILVDGVSSAVTPTGTEPTALSTGGGSNLRFGALSDTPDGTYFACRLDNWALFNEEITATQILGELFGGPSDLNNRPTINDPLDWWRFDNDYGDENGGAFGTPVGGPFFSNDHA